MCRDPEGDLNTQCFQGTRILLILLHWIYCEIPVSPEPHTQQVLRKGERWEGNSNNASMQGRP